MQGKQKPDRCSSLQQEFKNGIAYETKQAKMFHVSIMMCVQMCSVTRDQGAFGDSDVCEYMRVGLWLCSIAAGMSLMLLTADVKGAKPKTHFFSVHSCVSVSSRLLFLHQFKLFIWPVIGTLLCVYKKANHYLMLQYSFCSNQNVIYLKNCTTNYTLSYKQPVSQKLVHKVVPA